MSSVQTAAKPAPLLSSTGITAAYSVSFTLFLRKTSALPNQSIMEIVHVYTKKRSEFGRQPLFSDRPAETNVAIDPDDALRGDFIDKDPVDMAIQYAPEMSEHEVHQTFYNAL